MSEISLSSIYELPSSEEEALGGRPGAGGGEELVAVFSFLSSLLSPLEPDLDLCESFLDIVK